ncbi:leukocyte receptor cluster member 9 isoform X1 [Alosa sapidissima]|uniref:leukocyte receptor cluster member 9 isoform X1 n=2 Tax=Alosa sapidissima TaxID=34773 RepID=UPI001C09D8B9|nr:leukocyte receptor cluster member 9 isoform X1 [Alosa sapidissima]XP_041962837.1 leukocyte receptor cluster member 9 isoform X1 [Alosa sapidissima]
MESSLVTEQTDSKVLSDSTNPLSDDATVVNKDGIKEADWARQEEEGANLCRHFLRGRCHFGDRCRLSHSMPSSDTIEMPEEDLECWDDSEKEEKNKKNRKKMSKSPKKVKESENNEPVKKPRMRTADDVINRIRWDSAIDSADFVVGHIDRFLGVLERPFDEFAWDTSVSDCDYSEELALPRHRIQYFTYRGQRVWDRDNRTDRVFGSTGQTVMPPFGGKAQQQEDMRQQADNNLDSTSTEEHQQMPHREHEESCENTTEWPNMEQENTDPGGTSCGNHQTGNEISSDEPESGERHSLENLSQQLSISQEDNGIKGDAEQEWKSDWDGAEEKEHLHWEGVTSQCPNRQVGPSGVPPGPQELSPEPQVPKSVSQPPKPGRVKCRPTHFIGFRVDSPAALHAFQRLQAKVLAHLPESERLWQSPAKLHVTLSLLVLPGPAEVFAAAELLRTIVKTLRKPPITVTFTPKLKHFAEKVLHLVPQPLSDIQTLNAPIQQAFRQKGWLHHNSRCPSYHMTLAKAEDDRPFGNVGVIKLAKDINFGKLEVQKLYLCSVKSPETESGFYETVCAVTFPEI